MNKRNAENKYWDEALETMPREELEKRQLEDLKEIVKFAYDNAPYYKRSFDEVGVKPSSSRLSTRPPSVTPKAWVPFWENSALSPRRTWCLFQRRRALREYPQ